MGLLLGLDTAGPRCAVALCDREGRVIAARDPEIGRGHAERLMALAAAVLTEAGASYGDLERIAVTVGPGSFTGLRVGVAAARGLSLALGVPAVGVSTLEALAEPFREAGRVLAAIDAKRGEVYLAGYGPDGVHVPPMAVSVGDLRERLSAEAPTVVVGSGASIVLDALPPTGEMRVENPDNRVDLAALARLGWAVDAASAGPPRPLYLRGADAKPQRTQILKFESGNPSPGVLP